MFIYDGDGGRVKKITGTSETTYIGSLYETESDGKITKHIFAGANRVCSVEGTAAAGFNLRYSHSDHLGSSNVITDADGKQVGFTEFTPYGTTFRQSGSYDPKHKFTGKELDTSTGLYFYGARYYDPELGRFTQADTIVQSPYDPQSLNRYSYCRNNPLNYVDPTGHKWSWEKFWHAAVGVFVGVVASMVIGPAGFALVGSTMAGMIGGSLGGAITGGLDGGWKGALIGGVMGGILGGIGGWAVGGGHTNVLAGMFVAGAGVAGATNSWDSFAGGLAGGILGGLAGGGITSVYKEQFGNFRSGNGFRSNADVIIAKIKSGEINWRTVVSYFNDPNTSVEVKSELVDLFNSHGFKLQEQGSGSWSQSWSKDTTMDFVGGLGAKIEAETTMTINYLGSSEYGIQATKPITIGFLDTPLPFTKASFSSLRVHYENSFIRALETDMTGGLINNQLTNGVNIETGR